MPTDRTLDKQGTLLWPQQFACMHMLVVELQSVAGRKYKQGRWWTSRERGSW